MQKSKTDLPWDIYHRIYRLAAQKVDAQRIAATLNLPLKTVQGVLNKLASDKKRMPGDGYNPRNATEHQSAQDDGSFLDVYVYQKTRYTIVDFSGMLTSDHIPKISSELTRLSQSGAKTIALLLAEVKSVDEAAMELIVDFCKSHASKGRFIALLDPSMEIEPFIEKNKIEEIIPIFGTEKMFEEKAFALSSNAWAKKLK